MLLQAGGRAAFLLLALMAEELALGLEGFVFVIEGPGEDRAVDPYHDVVSDPALDSDPNAPGRDKLSFMMQSRL